MVRCAWQAPAPGTLDGHVSARGGWRARPETDIAIVADGAVLEALVNATRGGHDRLALDPKAIQEFRLRFEDEGSLQESEEAMEW